MEIPALYKVTGIHTVRIGRRIFADCAVVESHSTAAQVIAADGSVVEVREAWSKSWLADGIGLVKAVSSATLDVIVPPQLAGEMSAHSHWEQAKELKQCALQGTALTPTPTTQQGSAER